jgi:hypothetical protein
MITFPLPATFDPDSRAEFWRYADETRDLYITAGVPPDEARRYAIQDTSELAAQYDPNLRYGP